MEGDKEGPKRAVRPRVMGTLGFKTAGYGTP